VGSFDPTAGEPARRTYQTAVRIEALTAAKSTKNPYRIKIRRFLVAPTGIESESDDDAG
jgi:hypothetical protein